MYKRILIATDDSELAQKGVEHGLALAAQLQAQAAVVTVSEPLIAGAEDALGWGGAYNIAVEYQQAREEAARLLLEKVAEKAKRVGLSIEPVHVANRYAADGIIETAQAQRSDLIVMASHGRRGLGRMLLGSQTQEVLTRSQIPVLVVR